MVPEAAVGDALKQNEDTAMQDQVQPEAEQEGVVEATAENAQNLFDSGRAANKAGDFEAAADDLCKSLEIRVKLHGELAPECASTYYEYGCALLYKVQSERDVLSEPAPSKEKGLTISEPTDAKDAQDDTPQDDEEEDAEEIQEEEEESDLELAWKMMDIARVIYEKQHTHTLDEVDVITGLADISLEKEDFQTCFEDYKKALEILSGLVEPDNRQLAELYFKMALAQQLAREPKDAIEYCQKAVSICESRLQRLKSEIISKEIDADEAAFDKSKRMDGTLSKEDEIKEIELLLIDLKEKVDELHQMASAPPLFEVLKSENAAVAETVKQAFMAVATFAENGSKTAATNAFSLPSTSNNSVTHLGVVGRGIKRAVPIPDSSNTSEGQLPKKLIAETGSADTQTGFGLQTQAGFSAGEAAVDKDVPKTSGAPSSVVGALKHVVDELKAD